MTKSTMIRNYLKIAFRNLKRYPGYTSINVGGLGLGLACCFLIVLFIQHEVSFDQFHANKDRLYRIIQVETGGSGKGSVITPAGLLPDLMVRFPEIEQGVRFFYRGAILKIEGEMRRVSNFAVTDPELLTAFDFPLVQGDIRTALKAPNSIVISQKAAAALFGSENPIGQPVEYDGDIDLNVTGVLADVPVNSHLQFDYLVPMVLLPQIWNMENALSDYTNFDMFTYLMLEPGASAQALEEKIRVFWREREPDDGDQFALQRVTDIHFTTNLLYDVGSNRNPRYLYLFGTIGAFILIIACINFMNLATAKATRRAKEVGVRKASGASRSQIANQFMGESLMLCVLAIALALALSWLFMPIFNTLTGAEISLSGHPGYIFWLVVIGGFAGILAGSYPAFYLSRFRPSTVLKGEVTRGRSAVLLRQGLIVLQFTIAVALIIGTLTVYKQLHFLRDQELGFAEEQVLYLRAAQPITDQFDVFHQQLLQNPRILQATRTNGVPGRLNNRRGYYWIDPTGEVVNQGLYTIMTDAYYLETLGLTLKEGRNFDPARPGDVGQAYIVNETAVRTLRIENPLGHPIRVWDQEEMGQIIGVVEDFHFKSLHQNIEPVVINLTPWTSYIAVRVNPEQLSQTLDYIQAQWRELAPGYPFEYVFLDEDFDRLYRAEDQLMQRFSFFAFIAIFISCLGLFGLAAYAAEQRIKEIGVRKVLGASVAGIITLMSRDFLKLVLLAFGIAAPLAFFGMNRWLESFAYRTSFGVDTFALALIAAVVIALATVFYQSVRAAMSNPVEALRYE